MLFCIFQFCDCYGVFLVETSTGFCSKCGLEPSSEESWCRAAVIINEADPRTAK